MIPGLTLITVAALQSFTETTRHGQFHGDPDSERNSRPKVPDYVVGKLLASGKIALLDVDTDEGEAGASQAPATGDTPVEFAMTYKPVGQYVITGPGIEPETVRGKDAAEKRMAELAVAAAIKDALDNGLLAGASEAPID